MDSAIHGKIQIVKLRGDTAMTTRIAEIDQRLFNLEMKDRFDDGDRAYRDKLIAERRALVRAEEAEHVTELVAEPEAEKEEKKAMENTKISIIDDVEIESFTQTLDKIGQFQRLIKSQLAANHDYGIIPGTKKPTLLKPGAEKILMLMGLTSEFDILDSTRDFEKGFFQYQVKCKLFKNGMLITEGLASCNTRERKYINQDAYSIDNTILKMAKKRALIDATLLIASLSQIFTQDIEDLVERKPVKLTVETAKGPLVKSDLITPAQARRIYAISKGNKELCLKISQKYGYKSSKEIKKADYESICKEIAASA